MKKIIFKGLILIITVMTIDGLSKYLLSKNKNSMVIEYINATKIFSIGADKENEDFYEPKYFTLDKDYNIYILDSGNNRIQKYNKNGRFIKTIGCPGQGPGCFSRNTIKIKILKGNYLYLIDNNLRRITIYDTEGKYINSFNIFQSVDDICIVDNKYYCSSIVIKRNYKPIQVLNEKNRVEYSFGKIIEPTRNIIERIELSSYSRILEREFSFRNMTNVLNIRDDIIYSQQQPYVLIKYNKNGNEIKEVKGEVEFDTYFPLQITDNENSVQKKVVGRSSLVYDSIAWKDGGIIVPIIIPDRSLIYLDIYDSELNIIKRCVLKNDIFDYKKRAGITNMFIDDNSNLYCMVVSMEDNPIFLKYQLTLK